MKIIIKLHQWIEHKKIAKIITRIIRIGVCMSKNEVVENCVQNCDCQRRGVWLQLSMLDSKKYTAYMQKKKDTQIFFWCCEQNPESIFLADVQKMLQCKSDAFNSKKQLQKSRNDPSNQNMTCKCWISFLSPSMASQNLQY